MVVMVLDGGVGFLITMFLKFHIKLLRENKTTIENLEAKGKQYDSKFNQGDIANFYSVFGTNMYLWPFPAFFESGKPMGDGVYWNNEMQKIKKIEKMRDDEEEQESKETEGTSSKDSSHIGNKDPKIIPSSSQRSLASSEGQLPGTKPCKSSYIYQHRIRSHVWHAEHSSEQEQEGAGEPG